MEEEEEEEEEGRNSATPGIGKGTTLLLLQVVSYKDIASSEKVRKGKNSSNKPKPLTNQILCSYQASYS